jgi:hypothetical protein
MNKTNKNQITQIKKRYSFQKNFNNKIFATKNIKNNYFFKEIEF